MFLACIDMSQLRSEDNLEIIFPDRAILTTSPNPLLFPWLQLAQEAIRKSTPNLNFKDLRELEQLSGQSLAQGDKNCIMMIIRVLDYTLDHDIPPTIEAKCEHFKRWFYLIKRTLLFLIYPELCQGSDNMSPQWGFHRGAPPALHFIITGWLIKCIKDQDILDTLLNSMNDYDFIINILGLSFKMNESYINVCYKSANKCLKLFEE